MYIKNGICYADGYFNNNLNEIKIIDAIPLVGRMLLLKFSSGEQRLFDATQLTGEVFKNLEDEDVFRNINLFHGVPTWNDGKIDIAPEFLYTNSIPYCAKT